MATVTENKATRVLLAATTLSIYASKSVTALVGVTTTATATCTAHGYSVGTWVLIQGSDQPQFNGPAQITAVTTNTFSYTIQSLTATSAGTVTVQQGLAATYLWGNGTTPSGSPASVGALPTALDGSEVMGRITNPATAPTTVPTMLIYESDTGAAGTWRLYRALVGNAANASDQFIRAILAAEQFILVFFYGNAGYTCVCEAWGNELTSETIQ